jgi:GT2 family glycosyltransferase
VEKFLRKLCEAARHEDPGGLVTYVNFPPTEYLQLQFLDFACFNIYLESEERLSAYLARLQNITGERPLIMGEIGLDSRRNGVERQAEVLKWQITTSVQAGCAGLFVFAWTDDWHRGDHAVDDWDFGLTTRDRQPKPALVAASAAFESAPDFLRHYPRISVLVCSFNGAATIAETLAKVLELNYPDYEVIVIDDGSTDATAALAARFPVRLVQTENRGLSSARNTALAAATGDIVAYIDDDAYPDEDWLLFLATSFEQTRHAAIGGPNISLPNDGFIADCVSNAPGGPMHVLITDDVAEHIPGCNMAFRKEALLSIGGFDERFRVAGDDVDVCWRIQESGFTIGFCAGAVVWHHRRNSIARYWSQQRGYAKAEALLIEKWPSKYNGAGHVTWSGRLYGRAVPSLLSSQRIYYGVWGSALFQSIYSPPISPLSSLPLMPEWYVVLAALGSLSSLGLVWPPMSWLLPLFVAGLVTTAIQAVMGASRATLTSPTTARSHGLAGRVVVAGLYVLQPAARLLGRCQHRFGPWQRRRLGDGGNPLPVSSVLWREEWIAPAELLATVQRNLRRTGLAVRAGNEFDRWDLSVRGGLFGSARGILMVEEHGSGKQLFRLRAWPRVPGAALLLVAFLVAGACLAAVDASWAAMATLLGVALAVALVAYADCAVAVSVWRQGLDTLCKDRMGDREC